jgi:alkaline phosphatase D
LGLGCASPDVRAPTPPAPTTPRVTHGVAVGDTTPEGAVIWSRADRAGRMHALLRNRESGREITAGAGVDPERDLTARVRVHGLSPGSVYDYRVWFSQQDRNRKGELDSVSGSFRTPPPPDAPAALRFAWGGDLGGQNVCRDAEEGYPILRVIRGQSPDFFVGLGDMIYADDLCRSVGRFENAQIPLQAGRALDRPTFWAHWRYSREDPAFLELLASTVYVPIWDDHEVIDDAGPDQDRPWWGGGALDVRLLPIGLQAFLDYNPIYESPLTPGRIYRSLRWGRHVELFVLDTRQYRDASDRADRADRPKTMLGREQLVWLKTRLAESDATWKVVVSSVPMALPTGSDPDRGMDAWANMGSATGYEHELIDIVRFLRERGIRNNLWITTDVHFSAVFRHMPSPEDPDFRIYEVAVGPLNAGLGINDYLDTTLGSERLFYDAEGRTPPTTFQEAKARFTFGRADVSSAGKLSLRIMNARGETLYSLNLSPR